MLLFEKVATIIFQSVLIWLLLMSWVRLQLLAWYSSQLSLAQLEKLFDEHYALETSTAES